MLRAPLAKADGLYMTGITVWELYTGHEPFHDFDDDFLEDVIASGFQPNLLAVYDNTIRQLIVSYLEAGNPPMPEGRTLRGNCICDSTRAVRGLPWSTSTFIREGCALPGMQSGEMRRSLSYA